MLWPAGSKVALGAGPVQVHPAYATGLTDVWLVREGGGLLLANLIRPNPARLNTSLAWTASQAGLALDFTNPGTAQRATADTTTGMPGSDTPLTIGVVSVLDSFVNGGLLAGRWGTTGVDFYLGIDTPPTRLNFIHRVGSTGFQCSAPAVPSLQTVLASIAASSGSGSPPSMSHAVNGLIRIGSDSNFGVGTGGSDFAIGCQPGLTTTVDGRVALVALWRWRLSDALLLAWSRDPWRMFVVPGTRLTVAAGMRFPDALTTGTDSLAGALSETGSVNEITAADGSDSLPVVLTEAGTVEILTDAKTGPDTIGVGLSEFAVYADAKVGLDAFALGFAEASETVQNPDYLNLEWDELEQAGGATDSLVVVWTEIPETVDSLLLLWTELGVETSRLQLAWREIPDLLTLTAARLQKPTVRVTFST